MSLEFTPLANAVARLDEGLARYLADTADTQIRDGLIQRFEFTYDLSHKMLRRALEEAAANPEEIDRMSFPTLIRTGIEQGLVSGTWDQWRTYRDLRRAAEDVGDETQSLRVVSAIPTFLYDAKVLKDRLQARVVFGQLIDN